MNGSGAFEAKNIRSVRSLDLVERGEEIGITLAHGKAVARLVPLKGSVDRERSSGRDAAAARAHQERKLTAPFDWRDASACRELMAVA